MMKIDFYILRPFNFYSYLSLHYIIESIRLAIGAMAKNREKNAQGEPQPELPSNFYEVEEILNKVCLLLILEIDFKWHDVPYQVEELPRS
jgi:hypothetical protein